MFPSGITVEVIGIERDRHGDKTESVKGTITGCGFAPSQSKENTDQRQQVDRTALLIVPPGSLAVSPQDKIRLPDSTVWQVEGGAEEWANPFTGWQPGREVQLRRVTG